jgi:predicted regulator of amino acid metabolism with ACT domain
MYLYVRGIGLDSERHVYLYVRGIGLDSERSCICMLEVSVLTIIARQISIPRRSIYLVSNDIVSTTGLSPMLNVAHSSFSFFLRGT